MIRSILLSKLVERLAAQSRECSSHPLRVAIDGIDASGKTTLADELEAELRKRGHPVIRASIDHFHFPREIRYALGADSPKGYYENSFDIQKVIALLLEPLGPNGSRVYQTGIFDFISDERFTKHAFTAPNNALLLFDGVFLLKPELLPYWDYSIFLEIGFEICLERAEKRDQYLLGQAEAVRKRYQTRYIPGQKIYLETCDPLKTADLVIQNDDSENPRILS